MSPHKKKLGHAIALALATVSATASAAPTPEQLDAIVVHGQMTYRDRTEAVAPVLSYDLEYFQRFEPLTVGDMLKRVPSVAFLSDVLEYDGARLRGLDPGYTQILINGKKVPGAGADRSFFVDRIPAELVERIEIVRNASANRSGDAVAGALNIVLRDAYEFDGRYLRAGVLNFADGELKETYGGVASGDLGGARVLGGLNVQGRYNPKAKRSERLEEPGGDFENREDQTDVRDGTDYSGNVSVVSEIGRGRLSLDGLYVMTDRRQTENSIEYNAPAGNSRDHLLSVNEQILDIEQDTLTLGLDYEFNLWNGRADIDLDYAGFGEDTVDTEEETGYDDEETPPAFDRIEGTQILTETDDREISLSFSHRTALAFGDFELGVDLSDKRRDVDRRTSEVEGDDEDAGLPPYGEFERAANRIDEERVDPYVMLGGTRGRLEWEAGLRYESTDTDIAADGERFANDYSILLPSAHLRWNPSEDDRLSFSLSRTVRRPNFGFLLPLTLEEEYGDNDFAGNPLLEPERAWGADLGFEHRLGAQGIVGVNVFWRDVQDLVEIVNTGAPSATAEDDHEDAVEEFLDENPGATPATPGYPQFDPDSFVYTAANVGDGQVYGIEFDASTPLSAFGMENTGVFVNWSWLDSRVDDAFGERRFNDQARYVYNVGFIQDLPAWGAAFGASYRRQGAAESRLLAEEVRTEYGADLEVFVEKRFGEDFSVRLTGSNLLDASKDEWFHKFDTASDQADRNYDEFEIERETAGPVYQLIARYSF